MGLLDDLDQLINSQKEKSILEGSQGRPYKPGQPSKQQQQQQQQQQQVSERLQKGYETWSLGKLQTEARKYGFKLSNNRQTLVEQLHQVQEALEKETQDVGNVSMMSSSSSFLRCSSVELISDNEDTMSDLTRNIIAQAAESASPDRNTRRHQSEILSDESPEEEEEEKEEGGEGDYDDNDVEQNEFGQVEEEMSLSQTKATSSPTDIAPSLSKQLYEAITSDKALYHRILLFEPISFDEVSSTAKRAGVTGLKSKEVLRNWLDMQGICFYSAELTGPRHRH